MNLFTLKKKLTFTFTSYTLLMWCQSYLFIGRWRLEVGLPTPFVILCSMREYFAYAQTSQLPVWSYVWCLGMWEGRDHYRSTSVRRGDLCWKRCWSLFVDNFKQVPNRIWKGILHWRSQIKPLILNMDEKQHANKQYNWQVYNTNRKFVMPYSTMRETSRTSVHWQVAISVKPLNGA